MKLVIHAGFHKTGSSSIQHGLSQYAGHQISVINFGGENQSIPIINAFAVEPEKNRINVRRGLTRLDLLEEKRRVRQSLVAQLDSASGCAVLSGEGISMLDTSELEAFRSFVKPYCSDVQVMVYLRPAISYMESTFQENVKAGVAKFNARGLLPHYKIRLQNLRKVFGQQSIHTRLYEKQRLVGQDVVKDFFDFLGVPYRGPKLKQKNLGLSSEAIKILYCYWKFGPGYGSGEDAIRKNHRLIKLLGKVRSERLALSHQVFVPFTDFLEEERFWLLEHFGLDIKGASDKPASSASAIGKEADMYQLSKESLDWLAFQSSQTLDTSKYGEDLAREVAQACDTLRNSL
ncbi:hypothetical protein LL254_07035 [Marinobacter nauticus]|uniref:hypothetical protein n=1 Tax=Marinobacter nauticus TaxID=2743 RepID=UPI001D185C14|nr:hypothetical protein [Marinobacter nauticus]MCC4270461.1 hypothetical protein [Marinobacter nauticus]